MRAKGIVLYINVDWEQRYPISHFLPPSKVNSIKVHYFSGSKVMTAEKLLKRTCMNIHYNICVWLTELGKSQVLKFYALTSTAFHFLLPLKSRFLLVAYEFNKQLG